MTRLFSPLALHGGELVRRLPFPPRPAFGLAERNVVNDVLTSGILSGFEAGPGERFWGGHQVRALEQDWCERFNVNHAVAFNSATSALEAACAAVGIQNGVEVIATPWSMAASTSCILKNQGMPVFADVEPETFCLDPEVVEQRVQRRTRAIVVVDLFGCPARLDEIRKIATDHALWVIEDAAQAPGALYKDRWAGTLGDVGIFSLNQHKTLTCGEGGIATTNNENLYEGMALYRNHGETVGSELPGGNLRMTEMEAAVARVQLTRLDELTEPRVRAAERLCAALKDLDGITPPPVRNDATHVFYRIAVRVPKRNRFVAALRKEGIPCVAGYVEPLYTLPAFRKFSFDREMPVVEQAQRETVLLELHAGYKDEDVDDVIVAFQKVHEHLADL